MCLVFVVVCSCSFRQFIPIRLNLKKEKKITSNLLLRNLRYKRSYIGLEWSLVSHFQNQVGQLLLSCMTTSTKFNIQSYLNVYMTFSDRQ